MIIPKILPHHPQDCPLNFIAEATPSFDNLSQHLTVCVCKVGQYHDQRF